QGGADRTEAVEAEEFLRDLLTGEPVAAAQVKREATAAGLSWATVRRAQKRLGVRPTRRAESGDGLGGRGHWYWSLPISPTPLRCSSDPYDAHFSDMSTLGKNEHLRTTAAPSSPIEDYPELPECLRRAPALGPPDDGLDDLR